jgi:hypothetical protein
VGAAAGQPHAPRISRGDLMRASGATPAMPPIRARWMFDRLIEIGPVESSSAGSAPLSWHEIRAWQEATFTPLSAWEARTLRRMSRDFLIESQRAEDPHCQAPFVGDVIVDVKVQELRLRMALGA